MYPSSIDVKHSYSVDIFNKIEKIIDRPIISYNGSVYSKIYPIFIKALERTKQQDSDNTKVAILLRTVGGSVDGAERIVGAIRHHFDDVVFIIDEYAMSAGTMIALSGNEIMMHYAATLGPIDPQVINENDVFVPASGYIHKINEWIAKSEKGELSQAEIIMINRTIDAATLSEYESAIELGISLVEEWLAEYKFRDWKKSKEEKRARAREIAKSLSDFKKWHTHGRPLGIKHLEQLKLKINRLY